MIFTNISNLPQVKTKGDSGLTEQCPSGCNTTWQARSWTGCSLPVYPETKPHCYRSLQWRILNCFNNTAQCIRYEWQHCLHNTSCTGQWSTWSTNSRDCTPSCEGEKTRIRYCYLNGELANGSCLGGGLNNNQTDTKPCTIKDCMTGRGAKIPPTLENETEWSYTFIVSIALFVIMLLTAMTIVIFKVYRKHQKRTSIQQTSNSFLTSEIKSQTNPASLQVNSPSIENIENSSFTFDPSSPQPDNFHTGSEPEFDSYEPMSVSSSPSSRKKTLASRRLPSLPSSKRPGRKYSATGSIHKRIRSRITSHHVQAHDLRHTASLHQQPSSSKSFQHEFVESNYTRMQSFSSVPHRYGKKRDPVRTKSLAVLSQDRVKPPIKAKPRKLTRDVQTTNGKMRRPINSMDRRKSNRRSEKNLQKIPPNPKPQSENMINSYGYLIPMQSNPNPTRQPQSTSHNYDTVETSYNMDCYVSIVQNDNDQH